MVLEPGLLEEGRDVLWSPPLGAENGVAPTLRPAGGLGESSQERIGGGSQTVGARGR